MSDYKYLVIADSIRANIDAGNYPEGRLPSTSMLCKEFEASYGSVRTAIMILKTEGRVVGRQGEGVFVRRA